jgi:hypothetical protein
MPRARGYENLVDREPLIPHECVQTSQRFRPVEVAAEIEGCPHPRCDGQARDARDLVVGHSLGAGDHAFLR